MSKSKYEKLAEDLHRRLEEEKTAHARTRNELQVRIERIWRLVPSHYINLMGVYPALRRLIHVLAEAADLQDPTRGAAYEDTMRTEYTPDGETLTQTESGVVNQRKARSNVKTLNRELDRLQNDIHRELEFKTHRLGSLVPGSHWSYDPPEGECEECGGPVVQPVKGRPRKYCRECSPEKSGKVGFPESVNSS